jgi:hypothetical protein
MGNPPSQNSSIIRKRGHTKVVEMTDDFSDIKALIEKRVNEKVNATIAVFVTNLARRYKMNPHDVLKCCPTAGDLASGVSAPSTANRCRGMCGKGSKTRQCSRAAKDGSGYCGMHMWQGEQERARAPTTIACGHTHPVSILYQKGCPACEMKTKQVPTREVSKVIDLGF